MAQKPRHMQPGLMDPPVEATGNRAQQQWQAQLTQVLRTGLGQSKDKSGKFLTWLDLEDQGIVVSTGGSGGGHIVNPDSGGGFVPEEDRTPPPAPENLSADGGMTAIYVTWDDPGLDYNYRVEIHRSAVDDVGTAVLHGSGIGTIYQDVVGSDKTLYYYWARFVKQLSTDIIIGPWNQTAGTPGQAGEDPAWVLDQISGKFDTEDLKTQVFTVDLFGVKGTDPSVERMAFAIDTTTTPPRVAMDGAYIIDATIGDAKIANLTVDKLIGGTADFVEANIRNGSITNAKIGNVIQSNIYKPGKKGWILNKDGMCELHDVYVRGTITGSYITGSVIDATVFIQDTETQNVIPTEADTNVLPRYVTWMTGKDITNGLNCGTGNYQGGNRDGPCWFFFNRIENILLNIKSADYTGDGFITDGLTGRNLLSRNFDRFKKFVPTGIQFGTMKNIEMPFTGRGVFSYVRMFWLSVKITVGNIPFEVTIRYDIERRWDHVGQYNIAMSNNATFIHHYEMKAYGGSGKHASGCLWSRFEIIFPVQEVRSNSVVKIDHFEWRCASWGYKDWVEPNYSEALVFSVSANTLL